MSDHLILKAEVKTAWLSALRSGDYSQTTGQLRDSQGFCCLGVLCDLYSKEEEGEWVGTDSRAQFIARGYNETGVPPNAVMHWAFSNYDEDTHEDYRDVRLHESDFDRDSLAARNDKGSTFEEIATIIEEVF